MLIAFDLDGVLLNSRKCMEASWSAVQNKFDLQHVPFEAYFALIGRPFQNIISLLGITANLHEVEDVYFKASAKNSNLNELYPNAKTVLEKLKVLGHTNCIVTSKSQELTWHVLDKFGIKDLVDNVSCPDVPSPIPLRGKPAPDHLFLSMIKCRYNVRDTVFIGDMVTDYECAFAAGVKYIHADWGYGNRPPGHNYSIANDLTEIERFL